MGFVILKTFQLFRFLRRKKQKLKSKLKIPLIALASHAPTKALDLFATADVLRQRTSVEKNCQKKHSWFGKKHCLFVWYRPGN